MRACRNSENNAKHATKHARIWHNKVEQVTTGENKEEQVIPRENKPEHKNGQEQRRTLQSMANMLEYAKQARTS